MTAAIVSLIIGMAIGALSGIAFACCAFSEEIARKEEQAMILETQMEQSVTVDDVFKILRTEMITHKRHDKEACAWNGALQAVKWQIEERKGMKHD